MATIIETVNFRGRNTGASWTQKEWLDGNTWLLEADADFTGKPETARTKLAVFATENGMFAQSKILNGDIAFQAYTPTEEQRAARNKANVARAMAREASRLAKAAAASVEQPADVEAPASSKRVHRASI